jgi:hypothetical protein
MSCCNPSPPPHSPTPQVKVLMQWRESIDTSVVWLFRVTPPDFYNTRKELLMTGAWAPRSVVCGGVLSYVSPCVWSYASPTMRGVTSCHAPRLLQHTQGATHDRCVPSYASPSMRGVTSRCV